MPLLNFLLFFVGSVDFNHYSQLEPFEKELSCITDYIDLQRMRFGDTLIFHSDIQYTQFDIPPLSIQTLIENAIYHGIRKKKSGGILTLKTYKENNIIYIIVSDNGIGFDLNVLHNSKGNGIHNSHARIVSLTGGSLNIAEHTWYWNDCNNRNTSKKDVLINENNIY